jgi:hypothetical protein
MTDFFNEKQGTTDKSNYSPVVLCKLFTEAFCDLHFTYQEEMDKHHITG